MRRREHPCVQAVLQAAERLGHARCRALAFCAGDVQNAGTAVVVGSLVVDGQFLKVAAHLLDCVLSMRRARVDTFF